MYSSITIIFNPNSTGNAPEMARNLSDQLKKSLQDVPTHLLETKHAGHAEELAYDASKKGEQPLVISVSGDGGYNEVVNGAMRAMNENSTPICAVLAAGNANDHRRMVERRPLLDGIIAGDISELDLLEVEWNKTSRFAHSYIGLGLTPVAAVELNRHTLNALKELVLVVKTYWRYQPFEIELDKRRLRLDSLVLANISSMAKVLQLSDNGKPTDGKFEIAVVPHRHKLGMLLWAIKSATIGLGKQPQVSELSFKAIKKLPMQLDGEVVDVPAGSLVHVASAHRMLKTVR